MRAGIGSTLQEGAQHDLGRAPQQRLNASTISARIGIRAENAAIDMRVFVRETPFPCQAERLAPTSAAQSPSRHTLSHTVTIEAYGNGNPIARQACREPRSGSIDTPAVRHTRRTVEYAADRNLGRPDGLRAGSPPSPSPRSIRLTVRRLPRSPRLSGPGPHCPHSAADLASPKLSIPAIDWNSDRYSGRCCVSQRTIRPLASNFRT